MPAFAQANFFGINNRMSPYQIPDDTLVNAIDVSLDQLGNLIKRRGYARFNEDVIDTNAIKGLFRHYETTGVGTSKKEMVATSGTAFYKGDDALKTWTSVSIGGAALLDVRRQFVTFTDLLIFTNSTNAVKKYSLAGTDADLSGSPPTSKYLEVHYERVWLAGNATNPSQLRFSDIANAESWPAANGIQVGENDGDQITGIRRAGSGLIIWKNHSIWLLLGNAVNNFQLVRISENIGCIAPHSISEVSGRFYFLAHDGIYSTDGRRPELESFPIQDDIDDINKSKSTDIFGFSHGNKWYGFSYQSTSAASTANGPLLVMDVRLRNLNDPSQLRSAWVRFSNHRINAVANWTAGDDKGETYWADSTTGRAYQFDTGSDDDGTFISTSFLTKFYGSEIEKIFDLLYTEIESSEGTLEIAYNTSKPSNSGNLSIAMTRTGAQWDVDNWDVGKWFGLDTQELKLGFQGDAVGRFVQIQFSDSAPASPTGERLIYRGFNMTFIEQPAFV